MQGYVFDRLLGSVSGCGSFLGRSLYSNPISSRVASFLHFFGFVSQNVTTSTSGECSETDTFLAGFRPIADVLDHKALDIPIITSIHVKTTAYYWRAQASE